MKSGSDCLGRKVTLHAQYERLVDIAEINFEWTCSVVVETVFYLC